MKRSIPILTLVTLAACGALLPGRAGAQVLENRASRILVLPGVTDGSRPDITGGSTLRDDCDEILLVPEGSSTAGPGSVEIALQTGTDRGETWWKGLQLFIDGREAQSIKAEGNGGRSAGFLPILPNELSTAQLVFVKPKFLGAATNVYQAVGLDRLANRRFVLLWRRDRC
ncbi:MAG: hypothetical protein ABUT39_17480 [Acidobacteriota bacterium]